MPASGRHSYKGQGKKTEMSAAPYLLRVSARFLLSALRANCMTSTKFKWGQSVAYLNFGANCVKEEMQ